MSQELKFRGTIDNSFLRHSAIVLIATKGWLDSKPPAMCDGPKEVLRPANVDLNRIGARQSSYFCHLLVSILQHFTVNIQSSNTALPSDNAFRRMF